MHVLQPSVQVLGRAVLALRQQFAMHIYSSPNICVANMFLGSKQVVANTFGERDCRVAQVSSLNWGSPRLLGSVGISRYRNLHFKQALSLGSWTRIRPKTCQSQELEEGLSVALV